MTVTQIETLEVLSEELRKINKLIDVKHQLLYDEFSPKNIEFIFLGQIKIKIIRCMIDTSFHLLVKNNNIDYSEDDFIGESIKYIQNDENNSEHFAINIIQNLIFGTFSVFESSISNIFFHLHSEEEVTEIHYRNIDKTLEKINDDFSTNTTRDNYKKVLNKQISLLSKMKYICNKIGKTLSRDDKKFIDLTSCLRNALGHSNTISNIDIDYEFKGYHYKFKKGEPATLYVVGLGEIIKQYYNIIEKLNPGGDIPDEYQNHI